MKMRCFPSLSCHGPHVDNPRATLRDQFLLRNGDLFNVTEIRAGLERLKQLYGTHGYPHATAEPDMELDNAPHRIDLILRITEGPHTP
jgi:outer membrane protein assembly factor BamA